MPIETVLLTAPARRKPLEICPWCSMVGVPLRIGSREVCPECRMTGASSEEGAERSGQLPEEIGGCSRCRAVIEPGKQEFCWFCVGELCAACWDAYGHCGHPEAVEANRKARAWKPGDPVLERPW